MPNELSLQAGRVVVYQDVGDATAFTVRITEGGAPVDLSGEVWSDPEGLMTVDATDAASGELHLSCEAQARGGYEWRLVAEGDTTWLDGLLDVGSTRRVGSDEGTVRIVVENAEVAVSAAVAVREGLTLRSPDGTLWRVTVDDAGALSTTAV